LLVLQALQIIEFQNLPQLKSYNHTLLLLLKYLIIFHV